MSRYTACTLAAEQATLKALTLAKRTGRGRKVRSLRRRLRHINTTLGA